MKTLAPMSLNQLINKLAELGDAPVRGLGRRVFSYRGYYERYDVAPSFETEDWSGIYPASELVKSWHNQFGETMTGYKGGDYRIDGEEAVYRAGYGETGPAIVGLELVDDAWEPILCDIEWW